MWYWPQGFTRSKWQKAQAKRYRCQPHRIPKHRLESPHTEHSSWARVEFQDRENVTLCVTVALGAVLETRLLSQLWNASIVTELKARSCASGYTMESHRKQTLENRQALKYWLQDILGSQKWSVCCTNRRQCRTVIWLSLHGQ